MSTTSRRFLMTTWDGGGNVPPELGVAQLLVERGHHVHVVADPTVEPGGAKVEIGSTTIDSQLSRALERVRAVIVGRPEEDPR